MSPTVDTATAFPSGAALIESGEHVVGSLAGDGSSGSVLCFGELLKRGLSFLLRCELRQDHLTIDSDGAVDCPGLGVDPDEVAVKAHMLVNQFFDDALRGVRLLATFVVDHPRSSLATVGA
jgi:hypothetical protein